ncbi:Aste57867_8506 [Aphanomyces stellatus]|uniref:palmitoyl-protein hydrolase n=1 Tax=Aphanomyces stellatus TaxID=120398 RepID=A0A485KKI0_9STRA|nr:hypothetical protein As57867_008474 [Aphanomyces stellatus]VFT85392.1 Aste57867_8506 [Aphanomyces stellatus]
MLRALTRVTPSRRLPLTTMARSSSTHSVSVEKGNNITLTPKGAHTASLIFMHGLGDTAYGWADTIAHIGQRLPHLKCILPTAPTQPVTLNMGASMPSWYDIQSLSDRAGDPCRGIDDSRARIQKLLQAEVDAGVPLSRIVVGGFSQGGAMSLYTGFQMESPLAGILVLSGYLPNRPGFEFNEANKNVPLLMCHGEDDPVVRLDWAKKSIDSLKELKVANFEFKVYPDMEHSASMEEIDAVEEWLKKLLPPLSSV